MATGPSKKGLSFVAARDYILKTDGRAGWDRVLGAMAPGDAEVVGAAVGVGWYPLDLYGTFLRTIDAQLGKGDLRWIRPMAHFEAERDVPTIHRLLLKMVRPSFIVEKMSGLWPRYNSTGRLSMERRGERAVNVTLSDWSSDEVLCLSTQCYSERALELAGAKDVRIAQTTCRARGGAVCLFRIKWGAPEA